MGDIEAALRAWFRASLRFVKIFSKTFFSFAVRLPFFFLSGKLEYPTSLSGSICNRDQFNRKLTTFSCILDFPGLQLFASGKVRNLPLVIIRHLGCAATARISAFEVVCSPPASREKGRVVTQLSLFWFDFPKASSPTHLATAEMCTPLGAPGSCAAQLRGRSMLVARADMIAIECVVRGYLSGSGWKEYKTTVKCAASNFLPA